MNFLTLLRRARAAVAYRQAAFTGVVFAVSSATALSAGCRTEQRDVREWQATDHDNTTNDTTRARQSDGKPTQAPEGLDEVTLATWASKCVMCHGRIGRGDGPQGPMLHPRDLSDPAWQQSVTDERIRESIQKGLGKMPAFPIPEPTLSHLVKLIRKLNANPGGPGATPEAAASAAGAPSGAGTGRANSPHVSPSHATALGAAVQPSSSSKR